MSADRISTPLSVVLCGADGRMGKAIAACAEREPQSYRIAAQPRRGDDLGGTVSNGDVVIDFSSPSALPALLAACKSERKPLVIGTTGYTEADRQEIEGAAEYLPIVLAANFSVGVNTLFWLTRQAARILGPDFDLEVVEMHHRLKKDAPSGTARRLVEILTDVRGLSYADNARHGRHGLVGEREKSEIGLHAVRGGDVVGEHTVFFAANGERVELTHRASSRETFASGALRAAAWLFQQPAGLYDMEDVLGLRLTHASPPGGECAKPGIAE